MLQLGLRSSMISIVTVSLVDSSAFQFCTVPLKCSFSKWCDKEEVYNNAILFIQASSTLIIITTPNKKKQK